jgi:hypothetical protein
LELQTLERQKINATSGKSSAQAARSKGNFAPIFNYFALSKGKNWELSRQKAAVSP